MSGQIDNQIFRDTQLYALPNAFKKNQVHLEVLPFFRNNEYFAATQDGQTYFGYQLQSVYQRNVSKHSKLLLGALAIQNYGAHQGFSAIFPIVALQYYKNHHQIIFGTLQGAAHHQLIEPIYGQELMLTQKNEQGVQWRKNNQKINLDAWINWEENTERNINRLEKFSAGLNLKSKLSLTPYFSIMPNFQCLYQHQGNSNGASTLPLKTIANAGIGTIAEYKNNHKRFNYQFYYTQYQDFSITQTNTFVNGFGLYHHLQYSPNSRLDIIVNHWYGNEYQAAKGGAIYQSVNPMDKAFPQRIRQLLFLRAHYHFYLDKDILLDIRLDPYYDFIQKLAEPSYALYLRYSF